jgi:aminoglycoside 6'-N-acetyltransferase
LITTLTLSKTIHDPACYAFRAAAAADLGLLQFWLGTPEVVRWWGEPEQQLALLREDLAEPLMAMHIVSHRGRAFAYAQDYEVHSWPQPHLAQLPPGTRAIDAFIGEPAMLGRGHGAVFLRLLAHKLLAQGAPLVAIDPGVDNRRACAAYRNAGFTNEGRVDTPEGPALLMIFSA